LLNSDGVYSRDILFEKEKRLSSYYFVCRRCGEPEKQKSFKTHVRTSTKTIQVIIRCFRFVEKWNGDNVDLSPTGRFCLTLVSDGDNTKKKVRNRFIGKLPVSNGKGWAACMYIVIYSDRVGGIIVSTAYYIRN